MRPGLRPLAAAGAAAALLFATSESAEPGMNAPDTFAQAPAPLSNEEAEAAAEAAFRARAAEYGSCLDAVKAAHPQGVETVIGDIRFCYAYSACAQAVNSEGITPAELGGQTATDYCNKQGTDGIFELGDDKEMDKVLPLGHPFPRIEG